MSKDEQNNEKKEEDKAQQEIAKEETVLEVFKTINSNQIKFQFDEKYNIKDFTFRNDISHLSKETRNEFLYWIAKNFILQKGLEKIFPRKTSTILRDYRYYQEIIKSCVEIIRKATFSDEEKKLLIDVGAENERFTSFWKYFEGNYMFITNNYFVESLNELKSKSSELNGGLGKEIYKTLLDFISECFEEQLHFGTIWYRTPDQANKFREKWVEIINSFKAHPLSNQFKNDIDLLEYYCIAAEEQIGKYYQEILDYFSRKEMPFIYLADNVWYGINDLYSFPNVIGYPKYQSIMMDVEHYTGGGSTPMRGARPRGNGPEKKVTVRKHFADIGYYQIIPYFTEESKSIIIPLPDSITTQELHVAAFNEHCNMNYKVSEVQVVQEFFIKDDFAEVLNWKDEIEGNIIITNLSSDFLDVNVSIKQYNDNEGVIESVKDPLEIEFETPVEFTLKPKEIKGVQLTLTATKCGSFLIKIIADSPKYRDEVHKVIRVKAGFPSDISQTFEFLHPNGNGKVDEKRFSLPIPANGVDYQYSLSIYPSLTSHILDGIEANIKYPYGCIEQVFSALMPNLVYYDYLATNNALKGQIREKLESNIISGYLKLQSNQNYDGGFGWWSGDKNSIFLTALVLSAYKLLHKHKFLAETYTIKQIVSFLLNNSLDKKKFLWKLETDKKGRNIEHILSRFTDITLTSFVLFALQEIEAEKLLEKQHEFLLKKAIETLKNIKFEKITDCYTLYLLYEIFLNSMPDRLPKLTNQIKKYRVNPYWLRGSAIGTDVETTARLTQLFWKNQEISETMRNEIIEWIYKQKNPYASGGWHTTSDTRAVVEFLTSMLEGESCDLYISVICNGEKLLDNKHITVDNLSRTSYELQYIPLNKYLRNDNEGKNNKLIVSAKGIGAPAIKLVQENWIERKPAPLKGLSVKRTCKRTQIKRYKETTISLELTIPNELDEMIVVEEPLIPAARILDESLDELVKNGIIIGSKYVDSKIAFFLPSGNQKRTITYRVMATKKFAGTQSPTSIYPMYEPHKTQYGNITRYKFINSF